MPIQDFGMSDVLTVSEAAAYLKTKPSTVYTLIKRKKLQAIKVGNGYRIAMQNLLSFLYHVDGDASIQDFLLEARIELINGEAMIVVYTEEQAYTFPTGYCVGSGDTLVKSKVNQMQPLS